MGWGNLFFLPWGETARFRVNIDLVIDLVMRLVPMECCCPDDRVAHEVFLGFRTEMVRGTQ